MTTFNRTRLFPSSKSGVCASLISLLACSTAFATNNTNIHYPSFDPNHIYISVQGGISFSQNVTMNVATGNNEATDWDPADQGYNSDLGNSEVLGAAIGYVINPAASFEIEVSHRNSFDYARFQTPVDPKTRYFDFANTSAMVNLVLNGSGCSNLSYRSTRFVVDPYISGGFGMAFNNVYNFHSILVAGNAPSAVMQPYTVRSLAYQVGAGLNFRTCRNIGLGVNYRFINMGDFDSNNVVLDSSTSPGIVIQPWEGTFKSNEIYLSLQYYV